MINYRTEAMGRQPEPEPRKPSIPRHSRLKKAALGYAGRSKPVFRLRPGTKKPFHGTRGFYDATTNEGQVSRWWDKSPGANVGMPTGRASGILVVDVDLDSEKGIDGHRALEELERKIGPQPRTWTVATPRGGRHLYYRLPEGEVVKGSVRDGLDVRGEGGYAVLPPSRTERGEYRVVDRTPMAEATPELIEWARNRRATGTLHDPAKHSTAKASAAGEVIPEGKRNATLTSICGRLHDGTRSEAELVAELTAVRDARCENPGTFADAEVVAIARWTHRKEPCSPGKKKDPGVEEVLEAAGLYWYGRLLPGGGKSKVRDVFRAMMGLAAKHGELVTVGVAGEDRRAVRFSASCRQVAPDAGTTPMSVSRNAKRLREIGAIRKDDGNRHDTDSGTFLIIEPTSQRYTHINVPSPPTERDVDRGCNTTTLPPRPDLLRTPAPRWGDHVGNAKAGTLYALEAFGPQTRAELGERLGYSRPWELERNHLKPLADLGLVEHRGDGLWALSADYAEKTGEVRRTPYSTVRRVKRRRRTAEGRNDTEVVEVGSVASAEQRERDDREQYANEAQAFRDAWERGEIPRRGEWRKKRRRGVAGEIRELERIGNPDPPSEAGAVASLSEDEMADLDAILAYESRHGAGSFRWERASCKAMFYSGPIRGRWPDDPESLARIRSAYDELDRVPAEEVA